MKLCIAEKPSVGREIARVIGATTAKNGYMEGNGYWVSWTFGHLCTLFEPDDYTPEWKRWRMEVLPMIPPTFKLKLIPEKGSMYDIALEGYCPEVVQHTNWDYGRNGKGFYNDIFAPGWTVASLWTMLSPGRTQEFFEK